MFMSCQYTKDVVLSTGDGSGGRRGGGRQGCPPDLLLGGNRRGTRYPNLSTEFVMIFVQRVILA